MRFTKSILSLAAMLALSAASVRAQDPWGSATQDVPTLRAGESWTFTRTFTINVEATFGIAGNLGATLTAALGFNDAYSLAMSSIQTVTVAPPSFNDVYTTYSARVNVRNRTSGTISANGTGRLQLVDFVDPMSVINQEYVDLTLTTAVGNSSNGYNWTGVGDFSQIREKFQVPYVSTTLTVTSGTAVACFLLSSQGGQILPNNIFCPCTPQFLLDGVPCFPDTSGSTNVANLFTQIDISIDHEMDAQGLELIDFPVIDPYLDNNAGERFTVTGNRALYGKIELDVDGIAGSELLSEEFATDPPLTTAYDIRLESLSATEPVTNTPNCVYLKGQTSPYNDTIYYLPSAKELKFWQIGNIGFSSGTQGQDGYIGLSVSNFRTINTAATVLAGSNMTNFQIVPDRPDLLSSFTVSGSTTGTDTQVTMRLILPDDVGLPVVAPINSGNFSAVLTAPNFGDKSLWKIDSTERESGSFGIELIRNGTSGGYQRKVITVRFAPLSSAQDWELYE